MECLEGEWKDGLYCMEWEEQPLKNNGCEYDDEELLIFSENPDQVGALLKLCAVKEIGYVLVQKGISCHRDSQNIISVVPDLEEACRFLSEELKNIKYRIVYLWDRYTENVCSNENSIDLTMISNECMDIIKLVRNMVRLELGTELWLITGEKIKVKNCISSMIAAIIRVATLEYPELNICQLDFDRISLSRMDTLLLHEMQTAAHDDFVQYRSSCRYTLKLKKHAVIESQHEFKVHTDGLYIITGGLGGLGKLVTEWLIARGAKDIILLGRSTPDSGELNKLTNWTKKCIRVEYVQLDVTNMAKVESLFAEISQSNRIVKGVFHAAGVIDDATMDQIDYEQFKKVCSPKVIGSWNLHVCTKKYFCELEWFVLFSSAASVIGNAGQVNHAAANAFMDSLVLLRNAEGLHATSVNWGAWNEVGHLNKAGDTLSRVLRKGFKVIKNQNGLKALEYVLKEKINSLAVMPMDWKRLINYYSLYNRSMYSSLLKDYSGYGDTGEASLKNINTSENRIHGKSLKECLQNIVAEVLGGVWTNDATLTVSFFDYGMDSLAAIELRNKIQKILMIRLPATFVYEHNTINKILEQIKSEVNQIHYSDSNDSGIKNESIVLHRNGIPETISCQQKRWLRLIELNYGERVVPIIINLPLNQEACIDALKIVIGRHESLRWYFPDGKIRELEVDEVIALNKDIFFDFSKLIKEEKKKRISNMILTMFEEMPSPYERTSWVIKCICLEHDKFALLLSVQHLDFDGTSISVFAKEFYTCYSMYISDEVPKYDTLPIQYGEYIKWQKNYMSKDIMNDREFFKGLYGTLRKITILPGKENFELGTPMMASKYCPLVRAGLWQEILNTARKIETTGFSILLGCYSLLISELTGQNDITIATIVNGRTEERFKNTIGPFTAPFPFRIWTGSSHIREIVEQCNIEIFEVNSRAYYPVADLINNVEVFRNLTEETYFSDVGINFTNYKRKDEKETDKYLILEVLGTISEEEFSIFNQIEFKRVPGLHLVINELENNISFNFYYHRDRFKREKIEQWASRYLSILDRSIIELYEET
jgi:NADP-dependent 3-hydroxy acid dehydrogenase YdfG/acyl carrier protein